MFQTGEYVVYGFSGVCLVEEITEMVAPGNRERQKYYVLNPVKTNGNHVYAPMNSKKPLRSVMTKEQAEAFLERISEIEPLHVTSDKHREEEYKQAMKTCDYHEWMRIIKTLYQRREERLGRGKQVTAMDSRYWKSAEDYLLSELSVALDRDSDEIDSLIKQALEAEQQFIKK